MTCPTPAHGALWLWRGLRAAWRAQSEVNHIVGDVHYAALALPGARTMVTVHDTIHLEKLRGFRCLLYRWLYFSWPLRWCGVITAISENTRASLVRHFPSLAAKIRVIPDCCPSDFIAHPREFNSRRPAILQIGTRPHKNLERLAESLSGISCVLKIVGRLTAEQTELLDRKGIEFESGADLTDEEMLQAYVDADMVVFASLAEGFGMPVIEAQAVGRPLVTSTLQPMAGVAGSGACLVDPYDADDMRRGILKVIQDRGYRERLVAQGLENARRYTPEAVGAQYAALYRQMATPSCT